MSEQQPQKVGCLGILAVLFLIGLVMNALGLSDDDSGTTSSGGETSALSSSGDDDREVNEAMAYGACKDWVNDQLRAPGTASYPDYWDMDGEVLVSGTGNSFEIVSHVDAENAFGGEVRTPWTCSATLSGDTFRGNAVLIG